MLEIQELQKVEDKIRVRYSKLSKIFLVIALFFVVLVILIAVGIGIFGLEPNWALISLDNWIYICCILIGFFVILEIVFYFHYISVKNKRLEKEKPKSEFYQNKRLYVYTHPQGAEGGVYIKTYIKIDENSMLRLRTLIIPPSELWGKKEEK